MKTKKILPLLLLAAVFASITSCGSDDDNESIDPNNTISILGYWSADNGRSRDGLVKFMLVYNFVNSNTVMSYGAAYYIEGKPEQNEPTVPGHPSWYITSGQISKTYYRTGNKIIISDGNILTIDGYRLLLDNTNIVYTRWY